MSRPSAKINRSRRTCCCTQRHDCFEEFSRETNMSTIRLNTPIPGPKSRTLSARRAKAVPRGLSHGTPIYVAKAEEAWLEDVDGNRYIDFAGGIGCANAGHRQQPVIDAVQRQLDNSSTPASRSRPTKVTSSLPSA